MIEHYLSSNNEMCYNIKTNNFSPTKQSPDTFHRATFEGDRVDFEFLLLLRLLLQSASDLLTCNSSTSSSQPGPNPVTYAGKILVMYHQNEENGQICAVKRFFSHKQTSISRLAKLPCMIVNLWSLIFLQTFFKLSLSSSSDRIDQILTNSSPDEYIQEQVRFRWLF